MYYFEDLFFCVNFNTSGKCWILKLYKYGVAHSVIATDICNLYKQSAFQCFLYIGRMFWFSLLLLSQRVASRTQTSAVWFEHLDRELKNSWMPCFGSSQGCAWDAVLFPFPFCVSQSPCCLILVDLLHNLHQSWSPCDKPTYVSEMQDLRVDRSLIYAGDKGCWSMIMIVCLCQWFQCHSLCNWQSTWQSLQTYQAKTTNACVYSYELKGWISHGVLCCISSLLKVLKPNWGQIFHFVLFVCQYIFSTIWVVKDWNFAQHFWLNLIFLTVFPRILVYLSQSEIVLKKFNSSFERKSCTNHPSSFPHLNMYL